VTRAGGESLSRDNVAVIDGTGAVLMPGVTGDDALGAPMVEFLRATPARKAT
jgi:hypothetical protein